MSANALADAGDLSQIPHGILGNINQQMPAFASAANATTPARLTTASDAVQAPTLNSFYSSLVNAPATAPPGSVNGGNPFTVATETAAVQTALNDAFANIRSGVNMAGVNATLARDLQGSGFTQQMLDVVQQQSTRTFGGNSTDQGNSAAPYVSAWQNNIIQGLQNIPPPPPAVQQVTVPVTNAIAAILGATPLVSPQMSNPNTAGSPGSGTYQTSAPPVLGGLSPANPAPGSGQAGLETGQQLQDLANTFGAVLPNSNGLSLPQLDALAQAEGSSSALDYLRGVYSTGQKNPDALAQSTGAANFVSYLQAGLARATAPITNAIVPAAPTTTSAASGSTPADYGQSLLQQAGQSGAAGIPGSGSVAGGYAVPGATGAVPLAQTTTSGPNMFLIIALIAFVAGGAYLYLHSQHKA